MVEEVGIKRGDFGATYLFIVKNVDYSNYDALITVKSAGGTLLLDDVACDSTTATDNNKNTAVQFTPISGHFGVTASYQDYNATIRFSGAGFRDTTKTFLWQVHTEL